MESLKKISPPDVGEEELSREVILEGRKRLAAVVALDKLFDKLEAVSDPEDREKIADEIEGFLEANEKIIVREDKSGEEEAEEYRKRLERLKKEEKIAA